VNQNRRVYLDNAATTSIDLEVLDSMMPYLVHHHGNASSTHQEGRIAKAAVEEAREQVSGLFGSTPGEITFTSGGTESIGSVFNSLPSPGPDRTSRIITSEAEHPAVLACCNLMRERGYDVITLPVDRRAGVSLEKVKDAMTADTALVALMHVNNETGAVNPIIQTGALCNESGCAFLVDTTQSAGKLPVDMHDMGFDYAVASAHKLHGPKGIGALCMRLDARFTPFHIGGSQERGRRGGTEPVALIVGFGTAASIAIRKMNDTLAVWKRIRDAFITRVRNDFQGVIINGDGGEVQPNIVSMTLPYDRYPIDGSLIMMNMDLLGVAVSGGSACSSGSSKPSRIMLACGHDEKSALATIRFSFGRFTTMDDALSGAEALKETMERLSAAH
jgi:cysteine desulfurase